MIQINKTKNKSWMIQKEDKYSREFEIYEQLLQNIKKKGLSKIANNMLLRNNTKSAGKVINQRWNSKDVKNASTKKKSIICKL